MKLLIYNDQLKEYIPLHEYEKPLRSKFPELEILCSDREKDVEGFIIETDIILTLAISDNLIRIAKELKWIQTLIGGVNHIISLPSLRNDVLITSARGIHGPQVSEMAFLLMLALARNLPEVILNQGKRVWKPWAGERLMGKKIGIIGLGAIGQEIAEKAKAFKMKVYGVSRTKKNLGFVDHWYQRRDLVEMAKEVDYLVLSVPLTSETENMIGEEVLSAMKPTAYLINVSRGQVVDSEALIHFIKTKRIAGAGLDAFPIEPLPRENEMWGLENVIITPHVAGNIEGYSKDVLEIFEENLRRFMAGERQDLINIVDRQRGF
ncbi:MAG: NAD(P)-binding domain-containing protein [Proteobacteria bacterium]|nr:NAD(P)-binding domain-containing protein [Pseudomonadota bacterium]